MVSTPVRKAALDPASEPEGDLSWLEFPIVLTLPPESPLTDELLERISRLNKPLQFERTAQGELAIMAPASNSSDEISGMATVQVGNWILGGIGGMLQGSSGGFHRADGSVISPDAAWVSRERLAALTPAQREETFLPICPNFVIEVRSPSDQISVLQGKMVEWIECGTELGWLIVPENETVHVYRADGSVEVLQRPDELSAEPTCPGLLFSFEHIWQLESSRE